MPREQDSALTSIFSGSHSRRDFCVLYLANGVTKHLSRDKFVRDGIAYQPYIRSVGDLVKTSREVDALTLTFQNINSELGLIAASDLRLLDYAVVEYGRRYQSNLNASLITDYPLLFRGVLESAQITERVLQLTLITDFESLGNVIASRQPKEKCVWAYKNGLECTSVSSELTCSKTRFACQKRLKPFQFGGFEYFEEPIDSAPGSAGNEGGVEVISPGCFSLDTKIRLKNSDVEIGNLPLGSVSIPCISFDPRTEKLSSDRIIFVHEFEKADIYELEFEHGTIRVTAEHPIFRGFGSFRKVGDWRLSDEAKFFNNGWRKSKLMKMRRFVDKITVRNVTVEKHETFFANSLAVHNKPQYMENLNA